MKQKELVNVAEELNNLLGLDPEIDNTLKQEDLEKVIVDACMLLNEDDELEKPTINTLQQLLPNHLGIIDDKSILIFQELKLLEPESHDDPEDAQEIDLVSQINEADTLKSLKMIVRANDEFKALRGLLTKYKLKEPLKKDLLDMANAKEEKKEEEKPVKTEKKPEETKKPVVKKNVTKSNGGSFSEATDLIILQGGTWEEMIEACQKEADAREYQQKITRGALNTHLKYRLAKDEKYLGKLKITEKGIE